MLEIQDTLLSYAEVAIALAGFSAIVVVLKRGVSGRWLPSDADRFHGMVIHSVFAVVFCLLPTMINVIVQDPVTAIHIAAAILGVQMIGHAGAVIFFATTNWPARASLGVGLLLGLLQFTAFTDWGVHREFEVFQVGIIWHIVQAGFLFVMLVWVPREEIEL